jgi:hypothetical protein
MIKQDIDISPREKRKTLNVDPAAYELLVSEACLHYQSLLRQELEANCQKSNWSPHEKFSYEIINPTGEEKEYKLKCTVCNSNLAGNDEDKKFQNFFKYHCSGSTHIKKLQNSEEMGKKRK